MKLQNLLNIASNEDFNLLKDAALNGNKINTNRLLSDTIFEKEDNIYYINLINQRKKVQTTKTKEFYTNTKINKKNQQVKMKI